MFFIIKSLYKRSLLPELAAVADEDPVVKDEGGAGVPTIAKNILQ